MSYIRVPTLGRGKRSSPSWRWLSCYYIPDTAVEATLECISERLREPYRLYHLVGELPDVVLVLDDVIGTISPDLDG